MDMWQLWLIIAGLLFVLEMMSAGFLVFWIGVGAILASLISLITDNIVIQTLIFVLSSGILMFVSKPLVNKYLKPKSSTPTNVSSLIGKTGVVTEDIDTKIGNRLSKSKW